jgi:hypothetical protein
LRDKVHHLPRDNEGLPPLFSSLRDEGEEKNGKGEKNLEEPVLQKTENVLES